MTREERVEGIERITSESEYKWANMTLREKKPFKNVGLFIATAIEEAIVLGENAFFKTLLRDVQIRSYYSHEYNYELIAKAISTNKDVITIKGSS